MERVSLNKSALLEGLKHLSLAEEMELPELKGMLKFPEDEVPVIQIKGASLEDHIACQDIHRLAAASAAKMLYTLVEKKKIDLDSIMENVKNPSKSKFLFEINLFKSNVTNPQFTYREVVEISEKVPGLVNRVVKRILQITSSESNA